LVARSAIVVWLAYWMVVFASDFNPSGLAAWAVIAVPSLLLGAIVNRSWVILMPLLLLVFSPLVSQPDCGNESCGDILFPGWALILGAVAPQNALAAGVGVAARQLVSRLVGQHRS
jgi:hypothetical protein